MIFKRLFFFFLILTVYYCFVDFLLANLADPRLHHFQNYHRLINWDLPMNANGDFDNDGKKDLITASGCAFLSSMKVENIPENQKCRADKLVNIIFKDGTEKIGQKYIFDDLDFSYIDPKTPIFHSYLAKDNGENWKIFVNFGKSLKIYEIKNDGSLVDNGNFSIVNKLDEFLYFMSNFFIFLNIPLIPLLILRPIVEMFSFINDSNILFCYLLVLVSITVVFYVMWRRKIK